MPLVNGSPILRLPIEHTLPSSEADATRSSLKGFLAVLACVILPRIMFNPPVGIQDSGGVAAEEGNALGQLATLVKRNDGERATTTSFPIHGEIVGVGLVEGSEFGCLGGRLRGEAGGGRRADQP